MWDPHRRRSDLSQSRSASRSPNFLQPCAQFLMPGGIFSRRAVSTTWVLVLSFFSLTFVHASSAQELIDRIAARVENDIILLSEFRHLGRYQMLVDGKSENEAQLLDRLIDQWVVQNEADPPLFPFPTDASMTTAV